MKAIVVYESKYGNTRLVAEKIVDGMTETEGIETILSELNKVDLNEIADYDVILIGSPLMEGFYQPNVIVICSTRPRAVTCTNKCYKHMYISFAMSSQKMRFHLWWYE